MSAGFEWDLLKEQENLDKHGVSFSEAIQAFLDDFRLIEIDKAHSQNETRYFCFGKVNQQVMTVRFTYRQKTIRIIGAGYWRKGRKKYEEKNKIH
jgi:uncharacterized DUF497 family protein